MGAIKDSMPRPEWNLEFEDSLYSALSRSGPLCDTLVDPLVDQAVDACARLTSAKTRTSLCDGDVSSPSILGGDARRASRQRLALHLERYLDVGECLTPPLACLSALLKSNDTFDTDVVVTAEPYDEARVRVASSSERSVPLMPLLDADARVYAMDPENLIISDKDCGAALEFAFYSDPQLRDPEPLLRLVKLLYKRGLICYRTYRRGIVGIFTVG